MLLYLSFWPHVVEGPFDRWDRIAPAMLNPPRPDYRAFTFGVQRILWGMMKKLIIADRANMYVKAVFDDWTKYSGAAVLVGTLLYTLQLYAEFSGCMDMVLGAAQCFGVPLTENFRQPFFARSVSDFWRRWHITLGAWLREYVFQPVIVSKPMMRFGKWCRTRFGAALGRSMPVWAGLLLTLAGHRHLARGRLAVHRVRPVLLRAPVAGRSGRAHPAAVLPRSAPLAQPPRLQVVAGGAHLCAGQPGHADLPLQRHPRRWRCWPAWPAPTPAACSSSWTSPTWACWRWVLWCCWPWTLAHERGIAIRGGHRPPPAAAALGDLLRRHAGGDDLRRLRRQLRPPPPSSMRSSDKTDHQTGVSCMSLQTWQKNALRIIAFLLVLLMLVLAVGHYLMPESNRYLEGYTAGGILGEDFDTIDVLVLGDSNAAQGIAPHEMVRRTRHHPATPMRRAGFPCTISITG